VRRRKRSKGEGREINRRGRMEREGGNPYHKFQSIFLALKVLLLVKRLQFLQYILNLIFCEEERRRERERERKTQKVSGSVVCVNRRKETEEEKKRKRTKQTKRKREDIQKTF
jgi:hypothetical protein